MINYQYLAKKIIGYFLLILLVIGGGYYLWQNWGKGYYIKTFQNSGRIGATITYLKGSAWKLVDGRKVELFEGDSLAQGDEIISDENSRMMIEIDEGSIIRLDGGSEIKLFYLASELMVVEEDKGTAFFKVDKDESHIFTVNAGGYVMTATGTAFSVENEDEVTVQVFESEVEISQKDTTKATVKENMEWSAKKDEVKQIDEEKVKSDNFLAWSLKEEKLDGTKEVVGVEEKEVAPTPKTALKIEVPATKNESTSTHSIKLSGAAYAIGVILEWSASGVDTAYGYKIVKSKEINPTFPENNYSYAEKGTNRYDWKIADGNTWHFRVCQYLADGTCGVYSNDIAIQTYKEGSDKETVKKETESVGVVNSISLQANKDGDNKVRLEWSVDGYAKKGYKVVWSKNSEPTYPSRDGDYYHYLSSPDTRGDYADGLEAGQTYHFRVCEYLGGSCGKYSNQVSVGM